jgi:predicted cobalt transporter CbtA
VLTTYLRRGLVAGLVAGLLAGVFAFLMGESVVDQAIQIEQATTDGGAHEELFSRTTQKVGLFFATGISGGAVGGLFGLVYAYLHTRMVSKSDWVRSLQLAATTFVGVSLIPFLKYPANPPTVGDPATIRERTAAYLVMVALSLIVVVGAWYAARILREREVVGAPVRQVLVGVGVLIVVGVLFALLPASEDPGYFPAGLLWQFRITSLGTLVVLWTGLGVIFGALCERAKRREQQ